MPLHQSSPALRRPEAQKSDENFIIVSQADADISRMPPGEVSLLLQTLQRQVES